MKDKTFVELSEIYQEAIDKLTAINSEINKCWDNGDKSRAKMLECGSDQHIDTLFEIEEILNLIPDFYA